MIHKIMSVVLTADCEWMDTREWRGNQRATGSMHQTVRARAHLIPLHVIPQRAPWHAAHTLRGLRASQDPPALPDAGPEPGHLGHVQLTSTSPRPR